MMELNQKLFGVILCGILFTASAYAVDIVVSTPVTSEQVILGNSSVYVTPSGSITVTNQSGILAANSFNVANNEGIINVQASAGQGGIVTAPSGTRNANTFINAGTINILGGIGAQGMSTVGGLNTAVNTGVINMNGGSSNIGISVIGPSGLAMNTGLLTSSSSGSAFGLLIQNGAGSREINTGTILMSGATAVGMQSAFLTGGAIVNTGTILVTGSSAVGISTNNTSSSLNVINKGTVLATGAAADAIVVGSTTTALTNSGKVVSLHRDAFNFTAPLAFTLNPESFIGGVINLGPAASTTIKTGASQSDFWDLSTGTMVGGAPIVTGAVPAFYDPATHRFATYDPTAFSALRDELIDVSGATSMMIQTRLDASCDASCRGNLWISTFGSTYKYDGNNSILDYHMKYWGVGIGYDQVFLCDLLLGGMVGYGHGYYDANARFVQSWNTDADGAIAALYGRKDWGLLFLDIAVGFGTLEHSDRRFVNNNLAPSGISTASSKYDSIWVCPEIAFGANIDFCRNWSLVPSVRYRDAYEHVHSHGESGAGAANAFVSSQQITMGELKTELGIKGHSPCGCFLGRVGYLYRSHMHKNDAKVTLLGITQTVPSFYQNRNGGYLGLDAQVAIGPRTMFNIGAEGVLGDGIRGIKGEIALITEF